MRKTVAQATTKLTPEQMVQIKKALEAAGVRNVYAGYWSVLCDGRQHTRAATVLKAMPIEWNALHGGPGAAQVR